MKARMIAAVIIASSIAASPGLACKGDEELFADDFADPELSRDQWNPKDAVSIETGYLQIKPQANFTYMKLVPNSEKEFDACADITFPEANNPDGGTSGGFLVWFRNWENYYRVFVTPIGVVGVFSITNEKWRTLVKKGTDFTGPILKTGAGAKNTFRLVLKDHKATFYGNDQRLFAFKTGEKDATDNMLALTLFASSEKDRENAWRFSNIKVTK